jgi:lipopolysaccharide/colanic/teichoic acid biosynthesis glycosyltransferase
LLLVVAIAIKLESRGPVFYRCRRVGSDCREFAMLKFRKMHDDATGPGLTVVNDPRFTRVGRFLAVSKLDELPQLWNVLKGEMSIVGPRPESPEFVALRPAVFATVLGQVRPGITGPSQLAFAREGELLARDDSHEYYVNHLLPAKLAIDTHYAEAHTMRLDLRLLWWTAAAVVLRSPLAVNRANFHVGIRRRPAVRLDGASLQREP